MPLFNSNYDFNILYLITYYIIFFTKILFKIIVINVSV